jgi:hypothetical protein
VANEDFPYSIEWVLCCDRKRRFCQPNLVVERLFSFYALGELITRVLNNAVVGKADYAPLDFKSYDKRTYKVDMLTLASPKVKSLRRPNGLTYTARARTLYRRGSESLLYRHGPRELCFRQTEEMPRIPDDFLDCSIYLYPSAQSAKKGEQIGGSGVLVYVRSETHANVGYVYAEQTGTRNSFDNKPLLASSTPGQLGVRDKLGKPHGKILLAGEHLAEWQGFVEGAVVTGEEAANALMGK